MRMKNDGADPVKYAHKQRIRVHQHPNPLLRSGLFVYVVLAHVYSDFFVTCQNMVGQPAEQKINQFK